jgi:simple sugar transport system permease protein
MKRALSAALKFLLRTKLFWGLAVLYSAGIVLSPINRHGANIFLSPGNQSDVLRQVSNNGIIAVGMTLVIITAGIDLSVGSIMGFGSLLTAMLLSQQGWSPASFISVPLLALTCLFLFVYLVPLISVGIRGESGKAAAKAGPASRILGWAMGLIAAAVAFYFAAGEVDHKFGVLGVLITVPAVGLVIGALNGAIIAKFKMQPFIVTLAMMVAVLGVGRLVAGPNQAIFPLDSVNSTASFTVLRELMFEIVPVPGIFFLAAVFIFGFILKSTVFGRYVYALGGNEQAARLAGVRVDQVKIATYAFSGMLAALSGVLYAAQYRQGLADAGTGTELNAIAAVVIGGTNLMGGKGSMTGTLVGVLIFGFLGNILLLKNIDSNTQLVLKGAIIIIAVLLQEGQAGSWLKRIRSRMRPEANEVEEKTVEFPVTTKS